MEHRRRHVSVERENIESYPVDVTDDNTAQLSDMAFSENALLAMDQDPFLISVKEEDCHPYKRDHHFSEQSDAAGQAQPVKIIDKDPLALPDVKMELKDLLKLSKHEKIKLEDPLCLSPQVKTELEDPLAYSPQQKAELEYPLYMLPHGNIEFEDPLDLSLQGNTKLEDPLTLSSQGNTEFEEPLYLLPFGNTEIKSQSIQHKTVTNESVLDDFENAEQARMIVGVASHITPIVVSSPEQSGSLDCVLPHIDSVTDIRRQMVSLHAINPQSADLCGDKRYDDKLRLVDHGPTAFLITKLIERAINSAEISQNLNAGTPQQEVRKNITPHIVQPLNTMPKCINKETKKKKNEATVAGNSERVAAVRKAKIVAKRRIESCENASSDTSGSDCNDKPGIKYLSKDLKAKNDARVAGNSDGVAAVRKAKTVAKRRIESCENAYSDTSGSDCNDISGIKYLSKDLKAKNDATVAGNSDGVAAVQKAKTVAKCIESCENTSIDMSGSKSNVKSGVEYLSEDLKSLKLYWKSLDLNVYKCKICNHKLGSKERIQIHVRVHLNRRPFVCVTCGKAFTNMNGASKHRRVAHNPQFQCGICSRGFPSRQFLKDHANVHSGRRPYKCRKCNATFPTGAGLYTHTKFIHNTPDPGSLLCEECGMVLTTRPNFLRHLRNHRDGKLSHKCTVCNSMVCSKEALNKHLKKHSQGNLTCDICAKVLTSRPSLVNHIQKVHADGRYKCSECGKRYKSRNHLGEHLLFHEGIRKYCCPTCGKTFASQANYDTHKFVHLGKNFVCPVCGAKFNRNDNMKSHMKRMHVDGKSNKTQRVVRVFTCSDCEKSFGTNKMLKDHLLTHDERYSTCDYCSKSYLSKKRLCNHIISVHLTS